MRWGGLVCLALLSACEPPTGDAPKPGPPPSGESTASARQAVQAGGDPSENESADGGTNDWVERVLAARGDSPAGRCALPGTFDATTLLERARVDEHYFLPSLVQVRAHLDCFRSEAEGVSERPELEASLVVAETQLSLELGKRLRSERARLRRATLRGSPKEERRSLDRLLVLLHHWQGQERAHFVARRRQLVD